MNGEHEVHPLKYTMIISPDLPNLRFKSSLKMKIQVNTDDCKQIIIHSKNLKYENIKLEGFEEGLS